MARLLQHPRNSGMDHLTRIVEENLTKPNSQFRQADLEAMVTVKYLEYRTWRQYSTVLSTHQESSSLIVIYSGR